MDLKEEICVLSNDLLVDKEGKRIVKKTKTKPSQFQDNFREWCKLNFTEYIVSFEKYFHP